MLIKIEADSLGWCFVAFVQNIGLDKGCIMLNFLALKCQILIS